MPGDASKALNELLDTLKRIEKQLAGIRDQSHENTKLLHRLVRSADQNEHSLERRTA
jgi:hypothetical protein